MDTERWWPLFVDIAAVVWTVLFVVDVAALYEFVTLSSSVESAVSVSLKVLLLVFLLDLVLLYRWADQRPRAFVQSKWFLILTVIPWFRPLRLLRVGRSVRALRLLVRSRRVGSFFNKARRMGKRLWNQLRE